MEITPVEPYSHLTLNPKTWYIRDDWAGSATDDIEALAYYGSFGLLDPKMPFEAVALRRALGWTGYTGLMMAAGVSMSMGIAMAAVIGWAFDPMHKREGGVDDWDLDPDRWDFSKGPAW